MHPENRKILARQSVAMVQVGPGALYGHHAAAMNQIISVLPSGTATVVSPPQPTGHLDLPDVAYVSFRLAHALPATHSWGGYVSNDFMSSAEAELVANGCPAQHARSIATDMIRAHISYQYLLDRACLNLHELFFMAGVGTQTNQVFDAVCNKGACSEAGHIGLAKAHSVVVAQFRAQSAEAQAAMKTFNAGRYRHGELARLCRDVFCHLLVGAGLPFLGPDGPYGVAKLLPIYTNESNCFPSIKLPISYY